MLAILDNRLLPRELNWTLLGDSLYAEIEKLTPVRRIRPMATGPLGAVRNLPLIAPLASADAVFQMHTHWRPEWPLFALSMATFPKVKAAWLVDPWPYMLSKIRHGNALLRLDLAFVPYREAFEALRGTKGRTQYVYLPYAADTHVFRDMGCQRDIDILSMGRRDETLHEALLKLSKKHGLVYKYRENTGFIEDPREMGALAARARYFVVSPPSAERSFGFSPLVMRYLEGLAAGCRLIGTLPRSGEFEAILPRRAMLEVQPDGSDLERLFLADQNDAEAWAMTRQAATAARAEHGWDSRARSILDAIAGVAARKGRR